MKMARSVNHHNFKMTTKKGAIISKQSHFFRCRRHCVLKYQSGEAWWLCESESMIKHKMLPNMSQWWNKIEILERAYDCIISWSFEPLEFDRDKQVCDELHSALFEVFCANFCIQSVLCMLVSMLMKQISIHCCFGVSVSHNNKKMKIFHTCTLHTAQWIYSSVLMVIIIIEFAANFNHNPLTIPFTRCIYNLLDIFSP